jgi:hypothetical protein
MSKLSNNFAWPQAVYSLTTNVVQLMVRQSSISIIWHFTERTPEQQVEYLRKMEMVAQQITQRVFYKRVGFWCRQCEFLPVCTRNEKKVRETLVRIG